MKRNNVNKIRAHWFDIAEMDQYVTAPVVLTEDPSQSPDTNFGSS